jgi:small subunit ribosomal protein S2
MGDGSFRVHKSHVRATVAAGGGNRVAESIVQELVESGVHFGHRASRWNPKMAPYIYARKNLIHVIDIRETIRGLLRAKKFLSQVASGGGLVMFVGTKRQASETVEREATRCKMPYVSERWLGGTLTNFRTIRSRLGRLEELESLIQGDELSTYSKKMQSALNREYRKMFRNLNGMRTMNRLPEVVVVIDPNKEKNAVREARKLGIATVALIDTDCDPDLVDLPIPGNDDGIRSIETILKHLADAVITGSADVSAFQKAAPAATGGNGDQATPDDDKSEPEPQPTAPAETTQASEST